MEIQNVPIPDSAFPVLEADEFHPANDKFNKDNEQVKRLITVEQRQMTPRNVSIVKMHFRGMKNKDIAEQAGIGATQIGTILKQVHATRLIQLLHHLQASIDGPSVALRKAMLHRVAIRNEIKEPRVMISAVAELNKMGMNEHVVNSEGFGQTVQIQINQNFFPKTPLDG